MTTDNWNPAQYEKFKKEREQPFYDLMDFIQPDAFDSGIDLGCGTGEMTRAFHERFKISHTIGSDNSQNMLDKAKDFATDSLSFQNQDIASFKVPDHFDVIISNAAIQWVPNHQQIFQNIYSSLKSGGQMCVQMPFNHDYITHTLAEEISPIGRSLSHMLSPQEYAHLLYSLGFKEQTVLLKVYAHILDSRESVIEWVKGTTLLRFKNKLSAEDYEKFLKLYRERLFTHLPDEKQFFYPFKRIFLWARK